MMATTFESLKREAAHLEPQLEEKISRYQQLTQRWHAASMNSADFSLSRAEQGLQEGDIKALQQDIQMLFTQLQDLIKHKLTPAAQTPSQRAMAQRYGDILQDLRGSYEKSNQVLSRARERHELLAGSAIGNNDNENGPDSGMEHLLRERNHITNSMNAAASVIGQAAAIRQDLRTQGQSLRSVGTLISQLTSNIPGLNHLVEQIRRHRSRDDKIVAGVIASCILFTFWYVFG